MKFFSNTFFSFIIIAMLFSNRLSFAEETTKAEVGDSYRLGVTVGTPGLINIGGGKAINNYFDWYLFGSVLMAFYSDDEDENSTSDDEDDDSLLVLQVNIDYKLVNFKYFGFYPAMAVGTYFYSDEERTAGALFIGPAVDIFVFNIFIEGGFSGLITVDSKRLPHTWYGGLPLIQVGYLHKF